LGYGKCAPIIDVYAGLSLREYAQTSQADKLDLPLIGEVTACLYGKINKTMALSISFW